MTTLSELWDQNAPPPWWRRALHGIPCSDPERAGAWAAGCYLALVAVTLAAVLRP